MPGEQDELVALRQRIADLEHERTGAVRATGQATVPTQPLPAKSRQVWGKPRDYDWTAPSGQQARLHRLRPEQLIQAGLLNKLNTLAVSADALVRQAEGERPQQSISATDLNAMNDILDLMQDLVPLLVAEPQVYRDPPSDEERQEDRLYVSDIELGDRIALLNEAVSSLEGLGSFRQGSSQSG